LRVCVRTAHCWSQNFSERGVGSGWRRGGIAEGIYVFEDQGLYGLVALDGGYLLVYFLLGYDVTLGSCEGYSVGSLSVPDVFFLTKKFLVVYYSYPQHISLLFLYRGDMEGQDIKMFLKID
jgi:hypothetical protein